MEPFEETYAPEASSSLFAKDIVCQIARFDGEARTLCEIHRKAAVNTRAMGIAI